MKAAVLEAPGRLVVREVATPEPGPGDVLIQVVAAGICGSDVPRVLVTGTYRHPLIPGHEFAGLVAAVGPRVDATWLGRRVVAAPLIPCGRCPQCVGGHYSLCDDYDYLGSRRDGAFAEFVVAPAANLLPIPDGVPEEAGALCEPASVALHGLWQVGVESGDRVVVLGAGPIGLLATMWARILGGSWVGVVDVVPAKLALASRLGVDACLNAAERDPAEAVAEATGGDGADLVVEAVGVPATQEQALRMVRKRGRVLYLGNPHGTLAVPEATFARILRRELTIKGSWNSFSAPFPGREWTTTLEALADGRLNALGLVTDRFALQEAPDVFQAIAQRGSTHLKVLLIPGQHQAHCARTGARS